MENCSDAFPVNIDIPADKKVIITWDTKIKPDSKVRVGDCLGNYVEANNPDATSCKIKTPIAGKIVFLEPAGQEISPLQICGIEKCKHDVQIGKLCSSCGALVSDSQNDHVAFLHKDLTLSRQKSKEISGDLEVQVLSSEKLVLMLDLDNTLIHAESLKHNSKDVELGFNPDQDGLTAIEFNQDRFIVKLRPFLQEFLANLSLKYIIYVYTKGPREYAEEIIRKVDLGGIYVCKDNILSENELGANQFKSVNQVIHEGSLALILDDRVDVWGSTKNLIFTEPYHVFDGVQGKLVITKKVDVFLYMIRDVLETIHEIFYLFFSRGDRIKIGDIYHTIRRNLFAKERVAFYGIFHNEEDLLKSEEYKQLRSLGVSAISLEPTVETTLIFSKVCNRIKKYPVSEAPVVSLWYIYYCELYCTHLNSDDFDLRKPDTVIQELEKNTHKSLEEKNLAKEEMENYLRLNKSNEGGHEIIRDIVIRKLEERKDEQGLFREDGDEEFGVMTKKVKMDINGQVHIREVNFNIIEREEDHKLKDFNNGGDNQAVLDKEVNLVQHYLNE